MITKYKVKFDEHTSYFSSLKEWDGFLCKWIRQTDPSNFNPKPQAQNKS
jgi:hypothetical protein